MDKGREREIWIKSERGNINSLPRGLGKSYGQGRVLSKSPGRKGRRDASLLREMTVFIRHGPR